MAKHYMRHPDDILSATRCLSPEQRGIYNDLIDLFIARDGDLPDDDLTRARDTACSSRRYRRLKRELLSAGKIEIRAGMIIPTGGMATLKVCLSKSESARKSALARWGKRGIAPLDSAEFGDSLDEVSSKFGDYDSVAPDLTPSKTTKPVMRTHKKRNANQNLKRKKKKDGASAPRRYAFTGRVIRLTPADLERWRTAFKNIPNIVAELTSYDDYLADDGVTNGDKWFHRTSAWLRKRDAEYATKATAGERVPAI